MQSVFLGDWADAAECRRIMRDFYGNKMPATTYIPQPPCDGSLLAIEAWGVGPGRGEVQIIRHADHTVIVRHDGIAWCIWAACIPIPRPRRFTIARSRPFNRPTIS